MAALPRPVRALLLDIDGVLHVGGGLEAGIASVLVRTGRFEPAHVAASGVEPTATIDSIADLPTPT